jgi:hypothetical protein
MVLTVICTFSQTPGAHAHDLGSEHYASRIEKGR